MSLLERKLSNVLLFNAFDDLKNEKIHSIPVSTLAEISGYNSNDTAKLKEALKNLKHISLDWDMLGDDGKEDWGSFSLLAGVRFRGGMCFYEYPTMLAEKLAEPEVYGSINIGMQRQFVSSYTLVIYEICSRAKGFLKKNKPNAYTKWLTLENFKSILGVADSDYYNQFKELNRKIIKPSIQEINGSLKKYIGTDIFIEIEYKRANKSVTDIRFKIKWNPQTQLPLEKDENDELRKLPLYQKLRDRGLQDKGALHAMLANTSEYLEEKILVVDEAEGAGKIKSSVSGFLTRAIDDDYKPSKSKSPAKEKTDKEEFQAEQKRKEEEAQAEKLSLLKRDISRELRDKYIATLSEEEQAELLKALQADLPAMLKKMVTDLSHPSLADAINKLVPDFDRELDEKLRKKVI